MRLPNLLGLLVLLALAAVAAPFTPAVAFDHNPLMKSSDEITLTTAPKATRLDRESQLTPAYLNLMPEAIAYGVFPAESEAVPVADTPQECMLTDPGDSRSAIENLTRIGIETESLSDLAVVIGFILPAESTLTAVTSSMTADGTSINGTMEVAQALNRHS